MAISDYLGYEAPDLEEGQQLTNVVSRDKVVSDVFHEAKSYDDAFEIPDFETMEDADYDDLERGAMDTIFNHYKPHVTTNDEKNGVVASYLEKYPQTLERYC